MEGSAPAAELHQEQSQEHNYQVITDNEEAELKKHANAGVEKGIEGEEERRKTKKKSE